LKMPGFPLERTVFTFSPRELALKKGLCSRQKGWGFMGAAL